MIEKRILESAHNSDYGTLKNLIDYHGASQETLNLSMDICVKNNLYKGATYLLGKGADVSLVKISSLRKLALSENIGLIKLLLNEGIDRETLSEAVTDLPVSDIIMTNKIITRDYVEKASIELKEQGL